MLNFVNEDKTYNKNNPNCTSIFWFNIYNFTIYIDILKEINFEGSLWYIDQEKLLKLKNEEKKRIYLKMNIKQRICGILIEKSY